MRTFIAMICILVNLGWIGLVNRFAYGIDFRLSRKVNRHISLSNGPRIFSILSTYLNFRFAGENNLKESLPEQFLVMSNHQSILDIPLYMRFFDGPRLRFVAKAELGRNIPVVSLMLRSDQHCLLERSGSIGDLMKTLDVFSSRVVKNNWIPVIFPEGTRSKNGLLGQFYPAGFRRILDKAPLPVVVCALDGGWDISSIAGMAKNLKGGFYHVKILKIYPVPVNKAEQMHILEEGHALIQEQLECWRGENIG